MKKQLTLWGLGLILHLLSQSAYAQSPAPSRWSIRIAAGKQNQYANYYGMEDFRRRFKNLTLGYTPGNQDKMRLLVNMEWGRNSFRNRQIGFTAGMGYYKLFPSRWFWETEVMGGYSWLSQSVVNSFGNDWPFTQADYRQFGAVTANTQFAGGFRIDIGPHALDAGLGLRVGLYAPTTDAQIGWIGYHSFQWFLRYHF